MSLSSVASVFRRIPLWVYITFAALLLVVAAVVVPRIITHRQINAEIAALRAEGWPMTLAELNASYKYPPGANAADTLTAAFALYDDTLDEGVPLVSEAKLPLLGKPLPPEMKSKVAACLAANAKALELLHQGAAIPGCRWPIDLRDGPNTLLLHLARLRQGQRLLALEAELGADDNKPDEAAGSVVASLGLARSLRTEPLMISQLVRYAVHSIAARTLERVLSRVAFPESRLQEVSSLVHEEEVTARLERALAAETCQTNALAESSWFELHQLGLGSGGTLREIEFFCYCYSGDLRRDQLAYLRLMRKAIAAARLRPSELPAEIRANSDGLGLMDPDLPAILREDQSPAILSTARDLARLRTIRAALAVERFRLARGKLPEKLDELVPEFLPEIPADPFDDKPLRYIRPEKGYMIYSVGENQKDEGGAEREPSKPTGPDDIPFQVDR